MLSSLSAGGFAVIRCPAGSSPPNPCGPAVQAQPIAAEPEREGNRLGSAYCTPLDGANQRLRTALLRLRTRLENWGKADHPTDNPARLVLFSSQLDAKRC